MKRAELENLWRAWFDEHLPYKMTNYIDFDFKTLRKIMQRYRPGRGSDDDAYNDCIIMADTETSKKKPNEITDAGKYVPVENHVVAWTISIRAFNRNIVTLYGHTPSSMIETFDKMISEMKGQKTLVYFHNLSYDYIFLRKFIFRTFGHPIRQLNTKSHYPVSLEWDCGLILRDSLILAQRSLEKWANDLDVEHKKAVGKWDYDAIRSQKTPFTADELQYIEQDTLAGVECLQKTMDALHKNITSMPYTATGIPREDIRKAGKENRAREFFERHVMTFDHYRIAEHVYHGGYTHANRHEIGMVNPAQCYDFASSYPFCLLAFRYPMGKWNPIEKKKADWILSCMNDYAFMLKLIMYKPHLRNDLVEMPVLQQSKCTKIINPVLDNGRVLCADYAEIYVTEMDLDLICRQYDVRQDNHICMEILAAEKDYLPRYLTDYIYQLFTDKTMLKKDPAHPELYDPVLYSLAKAKLNSVYGLMVQKCIRDDLQEDFETGEYIVTTADPVELYEKYMKNKNNTLLYQWGVWCTAYAQHNLFDLGACIAPEGTWLYSDTDSCYATAWDIEKVAAYNEWCKEQLRANGYGPVIHQGREWWLGCAESAGDDDKYTEYTSLGAKRYVGRNAADNRLHITVAGVPKSGWTCLQDDINNFKAGLIFPGTVTGKLTHSYIYVDDIYTDDQGNETGDSIDLTPCDYLLDSVYTVDWESLFTEEIGLQVYDDNLKI